MNHKSTHNHRIFSEESNLKIFYPRKLSKQKAKYLY